MTTGVWDFAPSGYPSGAVTYTGPLLFPAGVDAGATNTGMIVLGPDGAVANFPATSVGEVGPAPGLTFTSTQIPYGTTPGSPTTTLTSPGNYAIDLKLQEGAVGATGPNSVLSATDVEGTPLDGYSLNYVTADTKAQWQVPKVGGIYSLTGIASTTTSTTSQRTLCSLTVPARAWAWWPEVSAQCVITNAIDTRVDLIARINTTSGDQVGYAYGAGGGAGATTSTLIPAFGAALPGSGTDGMNSIGYGRVAAGSACTIYLRAENQVSSTNGWSTGSATFNIKVSPVQ